jgi:hypothetical protein
MTVNPTEWVGRERVDITFSRASERDAELTLEHVKGAIRACEMGATIIRAIGLWESVEEHAYRVELIEPRHTAVRAIVGTAIAAGCTAVQVEVHGKLLGYAAEEWREHPDFGDISEDQTPEEIAAQVEAEYRRTQR